MSLNQTILKQLNTTEEGIVKQLDHDVLEIFSTMVGIEITRKEVEVDAATSFKDSATAMVGLAGVFNGLVSMHTSKKLAMTFASAMLGMELEEMNEDVTDALGEIANMLGGSFKHHFVLGGHEVRLSIPSVIMGDEYSISAGNLTDTLTMMFDCGGEAFLISICLEAV